MTTKLFLITKHIHFLLAICLVSCCFNSAWAKENKKQPVNFMELAATMLKDGYSGRALLALQSVDIDDKKTDLARFYTLQGLAYMKLKDFMAAKDSLQLSVKNGQQDTVIFVYLAQIHYSLKDYPATILAVRNASGQVQKNPSLTFLKAQSHWHLKQADEAINTLNKGQTLFPNDFRFLKRHVLYLVQLGLYQEAVRLGRKYLDVSKAAVEDYVAFGNALRLSKKFEEAANILEIARLQFPDNVIVAKLLAHTYLDQDKLNSAAFILEQAALINSDFLSEAAEIYRRAGRLHKALTLNTGIRNQKVKFKQRLSILLALKQFERAANMASSLYRAGLLADQNIRYALAYALFSSGRFSAAEKHLHHLKDATLFRKGIELRRLMAVCQTEPWQCT